METQRAWCQTFFSPQVCSAGRGWCVGISSDRDVQPPANLSFNICKNIGQIPWYWGCHAPRSYVPRRTRVGGRKELILITLYRCSLAAYIIKGELANSARRGEQEWGSGSFKHKMIEIVQGQTQLTAWPHTTHINYIKVTFHLFHNPRGGRLYYRWQKSY
jgi:hypothetical protein